LFKKIKATTNSSYVTILGFFFATPVIRQLQQRKD